jgi:hypothetical protein
MKMIGMTMLISESVISATPGLSIGLSWRTSLLARAMMSPTRWRLWKVWLLPSRLRYNSWRASRSVRCASVSMEKALIMSIPPRTSTIASSASPICSRRAGSGAGLSTSLKATPVNAGTAEKSAAVTVLATKKEKTKRL